MKDIAPQEKNSRQAIPLLIALHMLVSLAGILLHLKLHHPSESIYYWWASPLSVFSFLVIPVLYCRPSTVAWGFLLTAITVIFGTIGMLYFSLLTLERPLTLSGVLLKSTLPAIIVLWIKVPIAVYLLRARVPQPGEGMPAGGAR